MDRNLRRFYLLLLAGCAVGLWLSDVALPQLYRSPVRLTVVLGAVTAQLTVICVWGTLVRGSFWIRMPWTLVLLTVSWCGLILGMRFESGGDNANLMLGTGIVWAIGFISSFVPLKIAAMCFRWQLIQQSQVDRDKASGSSYAIRDVLIGMTLLAVSMAIARAMLPDEPLDLQAAVDATILDDPQGPLFLLIYGVVSLLIKLPCIWIGLGTKPERIVSRSLLMALCCFGLVAIEFALFCLVAGPPGNQVTEMFLAMLLGHEVMGAIVLVVCLALRGLGYRLQRSIEPNLEAVPNP